MNKYFFALGTNHTLSKIDIVNMLLRKGVDFKIIEASEEILIVSTTAELEAELLINELGSAAKIGIILKEDIKENLEEVLKEKMGVGADLNVCPIKFGISVYGAGGKFKELNKVFYSSRKVAEKVRVVGGVREVRPAYAPPIRRASAGERRILSTVAVDKNKLLTDGVELVICVGSKGIYIGETLAIQDYEGYSLRDYGRPNRDVKSGMIPPKLAKIMINLADKGKNDAFLDPFCGSGTFLQEMLLLGYKNVIGSDVEQKAIDDTRKNLEWLKTGNDIGARLIKSDARTLSAKISYKTIDAIVTEPYLGSIETRYFTPEQIQKEVKKLEDLYLAVFAELKKVLGEDGVIVIVFPIFRFKGQFYKLEILDKLGKLGFTTSKFIKRKIKGDELLNLQITDRGSIIYFRPGQAVSREIFVFTS